MKNWFLKNSFNKIKLIHDEFIDGNLEIKKVFTNGTTYFKND